MTSYYCTVAWAGVNNNGDVLIGLTEQSVPFAAWFVAPAAAKKEMLSIALAARSSGCNVQADVSNTVNNSTINFIAMVGW